MWNYFREKAQGIVAFKSEGPGNEFHLDNGANLVLNGGGSVTLKGGGAFNGNITGSAILTNLVLTAATSTITPGATSLTILNNAGNANNLLITDAGNATLRGSLTLTPNINASAGYTALNVNPTWTDTPAASTNYAFQSAGNIVLTQNNTSSRIGVFNGTLVSDSSAFNYTGGHAVVYYGSTTFFGSGTGGIWSFIQGSANSDATSSGGLTELGGGHLDAAHNGTGLAATVYGVAGRATLGPSGGAADGNITSMSAVIAENFFTGTAVTPGVVAGARGFNCAAPAFGGSSTTIATTFYSYTNSAPFNTLGFTSTTGGYIAAAAVLSIGKQGGNTSGTNNNYGVDILGSGGTSASGGFVNNFALVVQVPNPVSVTGGNNKNVGVDITGNGGTGTGINNNFAILSSSTAPSSLLGSLAIGTATVATANVFLKVQPDSTAVSSAGTVWSGISVPLSTLTLTGGVHASNALGLNLVNLAAPVITSTSATLVDVAATLAIAGPPTGAGAGPATITNTYALWSQAGLNRFDGAIIQNHITTAAINSSATATVAQVVTGYITSTSAAPTTITLPTGTLLGAALGATQGTIFDLTIDNTAGASTVTIAVAVNGILSELAANVANAASSGKLTVPSGVTGQGVFRLMFSSSSAYTFTRIA